ncbi:uncharacterized protein RSE6_01599 [Rhynchosporium secalis]|uniref:Uncharacterized protein n=1 Tax=Rhynchosporium secalis TaxID=38038 RepID=A0A1E1LY81_RHYSE|nr:uncharacterized protein RSE6_01599 [Rhynchosporium secalis]
MSSPASSPSAIPSRSLPSALQVRPAMSARAQQRLLHNSPIEKEDYVAHSLSQEFRIQAKGPKYRF